MKEDKGEEEDDEKKDEKEVKEAKEGKEEEVHAEAEGEEEEEEDSNVPTKKELKVQIAEMLKEDKDQTLRTVREKVYNSSSLSPLSLSPLSPHRINFLFFFLLLFSILVEQAFQQRLIWEEG